MASAHSPLSILSVCFQIILVLDLMLCLLSLRQVDAQNRGNEVQALSDFRDQMQLLGVPGSRVNPWPFTKNDGGYWSSWKSSDDNACDWVGVTCTINFTVERLDLSGWGLKYLVNLESLSNLIDLRELDLSSNLFDAMVIPVDIYTLTRLTRLDLSSNGFLGNISAKISACQSLEYIYLQHNQLVGEIPSLLGLAKLQVLNLADNSLTGQFPRDLGQLNSLVGIDLSDNQLSGSIPSLPELTNLLQLTLDRNSFTYFEDFVTFPGTNSLEQFSVSGNQLHDMLPWGVRFLPNLKLLNVSHNLMYGNIGQGEFLGVSLWDFIPKSSLTLDLSDNHFTGEIYSFLQLVPEGNLLTLNLSTNLLSGSIPPFDRLDFWGLFGVLDLSNNNFSGPVPSFVNPSSRIHTLSLENNRLSGDIVDLLRTASKITKVEVIRLRNNSFTGDLSGLGNQKNHHGQCFLYVVDLSNNNLQLGTTDASLDPLGDLLEFFMCNGSLREFYAGNNDFSGSSLPAYFSNNSKQLEVLDLSSNHLQGEISVSAFNSTWLPLLRSLNVSYNDATGHVPENIVNLPELQVLDVANNSLSGRLPYIPPSSRLYNPGFYVNNSGLCGEPLPPCPQGSHRGLKWWEFFIIVAASVIALGSCVVTALVWIVYKKRQQQDADLIKTMQERESASLMPLRELRKATNNFSDSAKIGEGGFGIVYMGQLSDGSTVAIKKSKREGSHKDKQQFLNEVRILSQVNHRNLVKLLGCCMENRIAALVFEFVCNGTLQEHLRGKFGPARLTWNQRLKIAVQTADALNYLHWAATFPIYHRDVKSANILLDNDLSAKVADFGISKLVPLQATHVSVAPQGTLGYMDPEYFTSFRFSDKSDVYSFGVVLLELISAKLAVDDLRSGDEASLVNFASPLIKSGDLQSLLDPALMETYNDPTGQQQESVLNMGGLALKCVDMPAKTRPSMNEVWKKLQDLWLELNGTSMQYLGSNNEHHGPQVDADVVLRSCESFPSSLSYSTLSFRST